MKPGDLVRLKNGETPRNGRGVGAILRHDMFKREQITRVLWNTGNPGWILTKRIELVSISACK